MSQKWNLQDIRPAEPNAARRPLPSSPTERRAINPEAPVRRPQSNGDMRGGAPAPIRRQYEETASTRDTNDEESGFVPVYDGRKKSRNNIIIASAVFLSIVGGGVFLSYITGGATVNVYPKVRELNVNAEFTAYKELRAGELSYEVMTLEASGERQVAATGQEEVSTQAKGTLEIKKTTPGAERLIKNTRFATTDGKVFRIQESVVVPGAGTDASGKSVPGTIRAEVFADEAGDGYNLPAGTTLQVPGFKEGNFMDLYNAISATNAEAFTGGFKGPKFIINENELAAARQSLQTELRDTLLNRVNSQKPAGMTTFIGSVAMTYTELPAVQYGDNLVTIKEQAILQMPLFKAADFATFIAKETIVGYDGEGVRIDNLDALTFSYQNSTTSQTNIANVDSLGFKITGVPKIVWTFDIGKLKIDLAGAEKTGIPQIMSSYSGIAESEVKVRPIWQRSMPDKIEKITINEMLSTEN
ncbi:MAG: hypothetical protein RLZZ70_775 [Candidatus Parcubacteria bacterium]|jgi:hypothetical protein